MKNHWYKIQWIQWVIGTIILILLSVVGWFFGSNKNVQKVDAKYFEKPVILQNVNGDNNFNKIETSELKMDDLAGASLNEKVKNYLSEINPEILAKLNSDHQVKVMLTEIESKPLLETKVDLISSRILNIKQDGSLNMGIGKGVPGIYNKNYSGASANGYILTTLENF